MADYSHEERMRLAAEGKAMPDGSYPTKTEDDLEHAFRAYGRETGDKAALRRYLVRRAVAMGRTDLIPPNWHMERGGNVSRTEPGTDDRHDAGEKQ